MYMFAPESALTTEHPTEHVAVVHQGTKPYLISGPTPLPQRVLPDKRASYNEMAPMLTPKYNASDN